MPQTWAWMLLPAVVVHLLSAPAWAAGESPRGRIAWVDFESEEFTGQEIPRGWDKSRLPGAGPLPHAKVPDYVRGRLSRQHAHGGKYSFALALDGGNVAYTYTAGLPVHADSDYLLTGWVRTAKLRWARAQLRLFMVDATGRPVAGAMSVSDPMGRPDGPSDGQWRRFQVRLSGSYPAATRLRITLGLVQPEIWRDVGLPDTKSPDIEGSVWWDDIVVYRVPRVGVSTDVIGNVFGPAVRPRLRILLEGTDHLDCGVFLTLRSADGEVRLEQIIDPVAKRTAAGQWTHLLPDLEPGLYEAELTVSAEGETLVRRRCRFVRLAEVPSAGNSGWGLDASSVSPRDWPVALAMAKHMQASEMKLSAWPDDADAPEPTGRMRTVLARLHQVGIVPTLVFGGLPPDLSAAQDRRATLLDALALADTGVKDAMVLAMARYGGRVGDWQLGRIGDDETVWSDRTSAAYQTARRWTETLLSGKALLLAWNADYEYDPAKAGKLSLRIPPTAVPQQIPSQLADFPGLIDHVHLDLGDEEVERLGRLGDLALRYAYARAGGVRRVFIDPPWRRGQTEAVEPSEDLLVARTLAAYLGDAQVLGIARLSAGSVAVVFRTAAGEGRMLACGRSDTPRGEDVEISLPQSAHTVDLWGRRRPLRRRNGKAVVNVRGLPILIAGCRPEPLALGASLRFAPQLLESTYQHHRGQLSFVNPYVQPVTGVVRIEAPRGWTVRPQAIPFSLEPGQTWAGELTVDFPYNASAGLKKMDVTVEVAAREAQTVRAPAFFYLALSDVTFDFAHDVGPDGVLEVSQSIVNRSGRPVSYTCFAKVRGRAEQSAVVQDLAPGAEAAKVFRFPLAHQLRGETLRTGLRELSGPGVLNHTAVIR